MKVLITGGYGFIGSHVAEQFHKEGYEVYIIDNLSSGNRANISFQHRSYILNIEDPKCREIFKAYTFDVVVHLAAQVSVPNSIKQPTDDANANIIGLINILQFAAEYSVKKFIYASSAAVYGNETTLPLSELLDVQPTSPYGIAKLAGENYCAYYNDSFEMDVLSLRFSNVYGPRQKAHGDGSVIATFIEKATQKQPIQIHGTGHQTRDFIYVKDVAFLIYRLANSYEHGIYNVSTNTSTSVNDLVALLESYYPDIQKQSIAPRVGDIEHSRLNNEKVKARSDWSPFYSLPEGLNQTILWAQQELSAPKVIEKQEQITRRPLPSWLSTVKPYLENVVLFSVVAAFFIYFDASFINAFMFGVFYIVSIGAIYGSTQAFIGILLATGMLIFEDQQKGRDMLSLLYDTTFLLQVAMLIFAGLIVGYAVQRKKNIIDLQKEQLEEIQVNYDHLEKVHLEVREIKEELQYRVRNNEDSFGKIYSIVNDLDDLEPEKIFSSTVKVVEKIMRSDDISIYVFNPYQSYLRLVARSDLENSLFSVTSLKVEDAPFVKTILATNQIYVNHQLDSDCPMMAAPLNYQHGIKAILTVNDLKFNQMSKYYENLFVIVSKLIESSIERAFTYLDATESKRFIQSTKILTKEVFEEILAIKEAARTENKLTYQLIRQKFENPNLAVISEQISPILRDTDYVSYYDETIYILLSNTKELDLPIILNRFTQAGFSFEAVELVEQL